MMTGAPLSTIRSRQRILSGLSGLGAGATNPYVNAGIVAGGVAAKGAAGGTGEQLTMMSVAGSGAIVSGFAAAHAGWATAAIPIVGPIIAGVTIALSLYFARKGPKQKRATTEIVNKVEPELKKNVDAYLALPVHYASAQAQALANFDAGWVYVQDQCNIPEMGNPGIACTDDRDAGSCKWKDGAGECWNWFKGYRDPIANDPNVVPDPTVTEQAEMQLGGSVNIGGLSISPLVLAAGGLALFLLLPSGGGRR